MNELMLMTLAAAEEHSSKAAYIPKEGWESNSLWFLNTVVQFSIVAIIMAILCCLWRLLKGPTLVDRGIASDTIAIQVVALVILLTVVARSLALFDAVLIVSILGFAGTVAFAQFIGRRGAA